MAAMTVGIIIPAHDEGIRLTDTLRNLIACIGNHAFGNGGTVVDVFVVVVDDGSLIPVRVSGETGQAQNVRVCVLRHLVNLGQGAALETGIGYARDRLHCDTFITMDADGQHRPVDVVALVEHLRNTNVDIVFGNRFAASAGDKVPLLRRILLKLAIAFESLITGLRLSDAHNGLRCFNATCARVVQLKQSRMAHATEFKQLVARHRLRYSEAPVQIRYTEESLRKGQHNIGSVSILKDLMKVYLFNQ